MVGRVTGVTLVLGSSFQSSVFTRGRPAGSQGMDSWRAGAELIIQPNPIVSWHIGKWFIGNQN